MRVDATLEDILCDFRKIVAGIIEDGKRQRLFRKDIDSKAVAIYLTACLDKIALHYIFDRKRFNIQDIAREFVDNPFKGLLSEKKKG